MAPPTRIFNPNLLIDTALLTLKIPSDYQLAKLIGVHETQISTTRSKGKAPANVFYGLSRVMGVSLHTLRLLDNSANQQHTFVPINTPTDILWKAIKSGKESEIAALIGSKPKEL